MTSPRLYLNHATPKSNMCLALPNPAHGVYEFIVFSPLSRIAPARGRISVFERVHFRKSPHPYPLPAGEGAAKSGLRSLRRRWFRPLPSGVSKGEAGCCCGRAGCNSPSRRGAGSDPAHGADDNKKLPRFFFLTKTSGALIAGRERSWPKRQQRSPHPRA